MSPVSYDTTSGVQGAEASMTVAGLAGALIVGMYRPGILLLVGGACALVAAVVWFTPLRGKLALLARFGLGGAVGTALYFGLVSLGVLPAG